MTEQPQAGNKAPMSREEARAALLARVEATKDTVKELTSNLVSGTMVMEMTARAGAPMIKSTIDVVTNVVSGAANVAKDATIAANMVGGGKGQDKGAAI